MPQLEAALQNNCIDKKQWEKALCTEHRATWELEGCVGRNDRAANPVLGPAALATPCAVDRKASQLDVTTLVLQTGRKACCM